MNAEIVKRLEESLSGGSPNPGVQAETELLKDALWQSNKMLAFQSKLIEMMSVALNDPATGKALLPVITSFAEEVKGSVAETRGFNEAAIDPAKRPPDGKLYRPGVPTSLLKSMFKADAAADPSEENLHSTKVKTSLIEGLEQFANAKEPNRGPVPRKRKRPS